MFAGGVVFRFFFPKTAGCPLDVSLAKVAWARGGLRPIGVNLVNGNFGNNMGSFIKSIMAAILRSSFFEIETGLEISAVRDILEAEVVKPLPINLPKFWSNKFVGDVYPSGFDIKIEVWYNLGFNPVFHGSYRKADKGVIVGVKASNYIAAFVTVMLWIASAIELYFAFSCAFHGDYKSAGIIAAVAFGTVASAIFSGVVCHRTVHNGRRKLVSMLTEINGVAH